MRESFEFLVAGKFSHILLALLLVLPLTARAVLTDSLTIGNAKAIALGHAVTADPPGIDSIHFNPAGLTRLQGRKIHYKLVTSSFDIGMKFGDHTETVEDYIRIWEETGGFPPGYFEDPIENSTSETEGAAVMLPFFGMQDLPVLLAPLGGMSYSPPGSNVTFATNVYSPLGAGFYRDKDDPGRYMGERLSIMSLAYLSPSLAYQVTDTLSVGFSLLVNYQALGVELDTRAPHAGIVLSAYAREIINCEDPDFDPAEAPLNFCGGILSPFDSVGKITVEVEDPFSLSYNFGVLWDPYPWLSLGMVYQQGSKMDMKGTFQWESGNNWAAVIGPLAQSSAYQQGEDLLQLLGYEGLPSGQATEQGQAAIPMKLPDHFAVGFSLQVTPSFKLNVDYKYSTWSDWPSIPFRFSKPVDLMRIAQIIQPGVAGKDFLNFDLKLEDTWNYAAGIEYRYNDRLALRLGIEDRPSSIPDDHKNALLPIGSGTFYGAGFEYRFADNAVMDFGVAYFHSEFSIAPGESPMSNNLSQSRIIYNPYAGLPIDTELNVILIEASYSKEF